MSDVKKQIDQILRETDIVYICAKCGTETKFKIKEESITCSNSNCKGRILYKKRTSEPVEFEAR